MVAVSFATLFILQIINYVYGVVVRTDPGRMLINHPKEEKDKLFDPYSHIRRRRYLGLGKKFKLNKRYQECVAPGDAKGHCKHHIYCPAGLYKDVASLEYLCVIERRFVGVCCPDDITSSNLVGSQLIMDLPAGGYDYEDNENTTGCGLSANSMFSKSKSASKMQIWPWLVALYKIKPFEQGKENQFCGGALLTDTHVLSAAHCFTGVTASDIRARLGEYSFKQHSESRARDYDVAEIIVHENYVSATYENDIAVVRLKSPTSFNAYIWPICLPPIEGTYENEMPIVVGWGQLYYGGPTSDVPMQVAVPVWPQQKCIDAYIQKVTDNTLCAAGYEGNKDSCLGDSGGPLMYQLDNGRWITIGVVSWGIGCGQKNTPGIYTKVQNYIPWIIRHTMTKAQENKSV
ncbi:unnamed protein product [Callosobruchus maculatus]|uniref:Phenoloxidase-activating factor 2 n=1 Tax=Callosobruchus maculatus TaxID=64391 RepID=A0A653CZY9_CALMS|nr:unnamed protein product [Callosobruchus maculatus]